MSRRTIQDGQVPLIAVVAITRRGRFGGGGA
jgi:hypothetical protein